MSCGCKKNNGQVSKMKQVVKTINVNASSKTNKDEQVKRVVKRLTMRRPI